jgi:hypothetical protein
VKLVDILLPEVVLVQVDLYNMMYQLYQMYLMIFFLLVQAVLVLILVKKLDKGVEIH